MLPDNGKPIPKTFKDPKDDKEKKEIEMEKQKEKMKVWKETHCIPEDKLKRVLVEPKYLFSTDILSKILKLKDIFLEFDEDGSSISI